MNLLDLVVRTAQECGIRAVPTTTVGATGNILRIVDWVKSSWQDIAQERDDWQFLRSTASFTTVAGQGIYTLEDIGLTDFARWAKDTFRNYQTSVGYRSELHMSEVPYQSWRDAYEFGATRYTQSRPMVIAVNPEKSLAVGPYPADGYTVTGDYFKEAINLVSDADEPNLPSRFHMAIVYRAMMHYGQFEAAPEVVQRGAGEYSRMMARLHRNQLPEITFGGAL